MGEICPETSLAAATLCWFQDRSVPQAGLSKSSWTSYMASQNAGGSSCQFEGIPWTLAGHHHPHGAGEGPLLQGALHKVEAGADIIKAGCGGGERGAEQRG